MIKNVVFDIGNVLVDFAWREFYASFNFTEEEMKRVIKATVTDPVWNEIDRGVMTDEEVMEAFIKNDPEMRGQIEKMFVDFKGLLVMFEYARGWIKDLQNHGYKVYCLSNMSYKAVRECADDLYFLNDVDGYILSCDVKHIKPEPEIYKCLFEKYKLEPSECVFFDDLERNVEAAKEQGMHAIVFKDLKQAVTEFEELVESQKNTGEFKSSFSKPQRVAAISCLSFIGGMYLAILVFMMVGFPWAKQALRICLGVTLVLPALTWIYIWLYGVLTKKKTIASFNFFRNKND